MLVQVTVFQVDSESELSESRVSTTTETEHVPAVTPGPGSRPGPTRDLRQLKFQVSGVLKFVPSGTVPSL